MNQEVSKDLYRKVLEANNLEFEESNNQLRITKSKAKNSSIQTMMIFGLIGIAIGIYLMINLGRIGGAVIGLSGILLVAAVNLREREKESEGKSIVIGEERIDIREGFKTRKVNLEDIIEFKTNVERHENLYIGSIVIQTDKKRNYEFLEIFGNEEELIQDDLIIISNYIIENYISTSDKV